MTKKTAFTLAEVLITLGIIGVVAAMTLPTLIQQHQKQVYVNGLKKAISVSQNMLKQMQADEQAADIGSISLFTNGIHSYDNTSNEDAYGNPSVFEQIIPKYLKVVKICKPFNCDILYKRANLDFSTHKLTTFSGSNFIDNMTGDSVSYTGFYLTDGSILYMGPHEIITWQSNGQSTHEPGIAFFVDVNGEKGPNTQCRDLFDFRIDNKGKLGNPFYSWGFSNSCALYLMSNGWKMDY